MSIRGVLFDMDGVLCDSEDIMAEAGCAMFQEFHGVTVQPEDFVPFQGRGEAKYLGGVAKKYGVTLQKPRDKDRAYGLYLEFIQGRLEPLPGVHGFIRYCLDQGYKTAVATGADRIKLDGNLDALDIPHDAFQALVTGEDIHTPKPDPEIFQLAASRIGLEPGDCLVIEDAISGVKAAKAGGFLCLGLSTGQPPEVLKDTGADWVLPDLSGAQTLLESLYEVQ